MSLAESIFLDRVPFTLSYDYIIYTDGTNIFAFNTKTKQIEFVSTDATQVYSYVFNKSNISVKIKGGSYNTNPVLAQNVNNITIDGDGMGNTVITLNAGSGNPYVLGFTSCSNITIRNLSINVNGANQTNQPAEGTRGIEIWNFTNVLVENVEVYNNPGQGIKIYGGSKATVKHCYVHDCMSPSYNAIDIGASGYNTDTIKLLFNTVTSRLSARGGGSPAGYSINVLIKGNIVYANQISQNAQAMYVDYSQNADVVDNIVIFSTIAIAGIQVVSNYQNVNVHDNVIVGNSTAQTNGYTGILAPANVSVKGNYIYLLSQGIVGLNGNYNQITDNYIVSCGIAIQLNSSSYNKVSNNFIYQCTTFIQEYSTADYNIIENNFVNVTGTPIAFTGAHTIARNNFGYNPQPVASITVGASPFTYQNLDHYPEDIIISGGTVSSIAWSRDGTTYYNLGLTSGRFHLEPLEYLQVTYTAAPTMTKVPL